MVFILNSLNIKSFCEYSKDYLINSNLRNKILIQNLFEKLPDFFSGFLSTNYGSNDIVSFFILFKYFLLLINSPKHTLFDFSTFLGKENFKDEFNKRFLPGNFNNDIMRTIYLYKEIKKINKDISEIASHCVGFYSCNLEPYYLIQICRDVYESYRCSKCKSIIKNENDETFTEPHNLYRVYKNEKHRNNIEKTLKKSKNKKISPYINNEGIFNIPYTYSEKLLDHIQDKINNSKSDFIQISEDFINDENISIADIQPLTFRILNLILNIFYYSTHKLVVLKEEENKDFKVIESDLKKNIEINMSIIADLLKKKYINNPALFLNFILEKIIKKFFEGKQYLTCQERHLLEIEINEIIKKSISLHNEDEFNFNKYKEKFYLFQEKYTYLDPYSLPILLDDEKNTRILESGKFEDFKFFQLKKMLNRMLFMEKLKEIPNHEIEFPITFNYIKFEHELKKLKVLNKLNPFVNEMINRFSYKISRKEARKPNYTLHSLFERLLSFEREELIEKFKTFKEGWEEIKQNASNIYSREEISNIPKFKKRDAIAYFLNDDTEDGFGIYIAKVYQYLCKIQNDFLNIVENAIQKNIKLFYLKNNFKNEIIVQTAKPFQVIDIDDEKFGEFSNFEEMIFQNCYVNSLNYKEIEFNFDSIEKALSSIIIQGKKLFSAHQNYIIYNYEIFRHIDSAIITNFSKRIPQIEINNIEKSIIKNYVFSVEDYFNNGEKTLSTLINMIFFLKTTDLKPETTLFEASKHLKKYVEINQSFYEEFLKNNQEFTLEKLVEIYNFAEKINYERIKKNISDVYKIDKLSKEKEYIINEYFTKNINIIIGKLQLATAIRRFVCRFLIKEESSEKALDLFPYIFDKEELWEKEIFYDERFKEEKINIIRANNNKHELKVKISEAVSLYDFLGGDAEIIENKNYDNLINIENAQRNEDYITNKNTIDKKRTLNSKKSKNHRLND